jgi:hypothetical protein
LLSHLGNRYGEALSAQRAVLRAAIPDWRGHELGTQGDSFFVVFAEIRSLIDTSLARGVPELFLVEEEYRLSLLAAEATFVEEFIGKITDPQSGWGATWAQFHGESGPLPNAAT